DFARRGFIFGGAVAVSASVFFGVNRIASYALADAPEDDAAGGEVSIVEFGDDGQRLKTTKRQKIRKTKAEWKKQLSADSYEVTRRAATEAPESGELTHEHRSGIFRCICCDNALFSSTAKFESGTGWPSFWEPIVRENVYEKTDVSLGVVRREVKCA